MTGRTEIERRITKCATDAAQALLATPLFETARGCLEAHHLPLGAFVVEDVARREFAQREEARAGDELALVARHPRSYRQRWEVVAR
jgi:hypothetical protein